MSYVTLPGRVGYHRSMHCFRAVVFLVLTAFYGNAQTRQTRNIILITSDGLRWQELFSGIDPLLKDQKSAGMEEAADLRVKLWKPSAGERRSALMPFFWSTFATKGVVLGNVGKQSSVQVKNGFRVSYPGYSEILTGRARDEIIKGNDPIQNPTPTVLEFLRRKLGLSARQVALFGSWDMFHFIGESRPGSVFINSGYENVEAGASPRLRELNGLQFQMLTPERSVRHDYVTFEMALEYLRTEKPRVLHIAFAETDDWAHARRYDRVLDSIGYVDRSLGQLWEFINSSRDYRGATTIILTADHGRGSTLEDWHSHGDKVPEARQIWIAITGPDTPPVGEAVNTPEAFQRDIAPTMLDLLGIDYREYEGVEGKPIALARAQASGGSQ